jgi:preprotein translocase subunit SecG
MSILIGIFTFVLVLISVFVVLLVLMQRAKNDGGMGAALGGGATEATFGADTGNVLTGATIKAAVAFFILSFGLYLGHIYQRNHAIDGGIVLPSLDAPATLPTAEDAPVTGNAAP